MTLRPLLFAMRYALVRHTKAQSLGGEGVLQLPDKTEAEVPGACVRARVLRARKMARHGLDLFLMRGIRIC
jgi:hypothetical protein